MPRNEQCPSCGLGPEDRAGDHTRAGLLIREECVADLRNLVARLRQKEEDAHNSLDMLEPIPTRQTKAGVTLTVCGRIERYRDASRG